MKIEKIIEQFLEGKIKAKEVIKLFENGELTLADIKDKLNFGILIQDLCKKYSEVMNGAGVNLPYSISWQDTILALMIAIENKKPIEEVANSFYVFKDDLDY